MPIFYYKPKFYVNQSSSKDEKFRYKCELVIPRCLVKTDNHFEIVCRWLEERYASIICKSDYYWYYTYWWSIIFLTNNIRLTNILSARCGGARCGENPHNSPKNRSSYIPEQDIHTSYSEHDQLDSNLIADLLYYADLVGQLDDGGWLYPDETIQLNEVWSDIDELFY